MILTVWLLHSIRLAAALGVALLAMHRQFKGIDFSALPVARPCLILDGRAYLSKPEIAHLRQLGYQYRGIGR